MTMQIKRASRKSVHLLISLSGPSGSGKTLSALKMGRGLVGPDGKLGVIDTESGRAGMYADDVTFDSIDLTAPFSPDRYIEALRAFEDAGYDAVVIDSGSHEWAGTGGVLEMAEGQKKRNGSPLSGVAKWRRPKLAHNRFMAELLRTRMHVIICLRTKEKVSQHFDGGQEVIVKGAPTEIQEQDFIFEMTASAMLSNEDGKRGHPSMKKVPGALAKAFPKDKPISEETGKAIASWLGKVDRDPEAERLHRDALDVARKGSEEFRAYWKKLAKAKRGVLQPHMEELRRAAEAADEAARPVDEDDPTAALNEQIEAGNAPEEGAPLPPHDPETGEIKEPATEPTDDDPFN